MYANLLPEKGLHVSEELSHHDQTTLNLHWVCRNYHFKKRTIYLLCSIHLAIHVHGIQLTSTRARPGKCSKAKI